MEDDDEESPEECKVCITRYDMAKRRPRTLPCGHTFCSACLGGMIKDGGFMCPSCREAHHATTADAFPISYDMEAIIRKLRIMQYKAESSSNPSSPTLMKEREEAVKSVIAHLKDTHTQLGRYEAQLQDWLGDHKDIMDRLKDLVARNETAVKLLQDETGILQYQKSKGEEAMRQMEAMQHALSSASSPQEAVSAIDEAETKSSEAEDWIEHCQIIFPDQQTAHTSLTVRQVSFRALEEVKKGKGEEGEGGEPPPPDSPPSLTIMEKVDLIAPLLSVDTLTRLGAPVRRLLEEGRVFAVHKDKDSTTRHARVTLRSEQVHLHALPPVTTPAPTPTPTHTIQHEALLRLVDPASILVFLTLEWSGSEGGTVYVRLSPDTELARQFLLLCTGERGPSYAQSRLLGVWNKGTEFEMVGGGDYQRNDGHGGAPLVEDLKPRKEYQRAALAGTVRAMHGPVSNKSAQFSISTQDCPNREWHWAFGRVEAGLGVVKSAAAHKVIKDVVVADCGVVVPV